MVLYIWKSKTIKDIYIIGLLLDSLCLLSIDSCSTVSSGNDSVVVESV